ncbi:HTTM domain-containing protein [Myroides sp. LJL110]
MSVQQESFLTTVCRKLTRPIDNSGLLIFRMLFGFLFACESFGAILTGWVTENLVDVNLTFNHIYMDFLQVLVGPQMYFYFLIMGLASIGVMLGYRYRLSIVILTLLWAGAYFMQKTSYNNHYYLLLIICLYMCFLPANDYASLDVKNKRKSKRLWMPIWVSYLFIAQISIVYFYGTLAKFYPDWLNGTFTTLMYSHANIPIFLKDIFTTKSFSIAIAYLGIAFDALIIPMLLYKPTRNFGVIASLIFHLFNSVTLQIGIFPYFALSFALFFYSPDSLRAMFFKTKPSFIDKNLFNTNGYINSYCKLILVSILFIQVLLPLRSYFIKGDILWTDQGHRLSWRMMLRSRSGYTNFIVEDKQSKQTHKYELSNVLTPKQQARLNTSDMIWQMAQIIKKQYALQGKDVAVYAQSYISVNNRKYAPYVDSSIDLAQIKWNYFSHSNWLLPMPDDFYGKSDF